MERHMVNLFILYIAPHQSGVIMFGCPVLSVVVCTAASDYGYHQSMVVHYRDEDVLLWSLVWL